MREKSGLWIAGRIGILLVFGIMMPMQTCSRIKMRHDIEINMHKWDVFHDYAGKCDAAYSRAEKEPVSSPEWNRDVAEGNMWLGKMQQEKKHIEGTNAP
jgi:hypothetical protein